MSNVRGTKYANIYRYANIWKYQNLPDPTLTQIKTFIMLNFQSMNPSYPYQLTT